MTFSEIIKNDADQKYLQLLAGKTECAITRAHVSSCDEFVEKNKAYHLRLNQEAEELKNAVDVIKAKKKEADKAKKNAELAAKKAEEERLRLEQERMRATAARKKTVRTITIVSIIVAIIVSIVVISKIIDAAKYSENNIAISILSKGSGFKSYYYNNYVTGLEMEVENKGSINIVEIRGLMEIYNSNEQKLIATNVTLTGNMNVKRSVTFQLDIDEKESDKIRELYNTSLDGLKITFQLTQVIYEGYKTKNFDNAKVRIISSISKDAIDNPSKENAVEFRNVLNYVIANSTELLTWLHHDVSNDVIVPDQGLTYISYSNNCSCYKADYSQSYIGSSVFFQIDTSYASTIVNAFKQKLSKEGWTSIYDDGFEFEYTKGKTHIVFEEVRESTVWNGYTNEFQYYYMNFSAFIIN